MPFCDDAPPYLLVIHHSYQRGLQTASLTENRSPVGWFGLANRY